MSLAKTAFEHGIKDAEELLAHFDAMNANPPPPNAEVLKRGAGHGTNGMGNIRRRPSNRRCPKRLAAVAGSYVGNFILKTAG